MKKIIKNKKIKPSLNYNLTNKDISYSIIPSVSCQHYVILILLFIPSSTFSEIVLFYNLYRILFNVIIKIICYSF